MGMGVGVGDVVKAPLAFLVASRDTDSEKEQEIKWRS